MNAKQTEGTPYSLYHHAQALQWATEHMAGILNQEAKQPTPEALKVIGSFMASAILRAFAAELHLKALYEQELGRQPDHTHDLEKLFHELPEKTRTTLDGIFRVLVSLSVRNYDPGKTIEQVLREHSRDFETWRYIYENPDGASLDLQYLNFAITAIDQYHQNRLTAITDGAG